MVASIVDADLIIADLTGSNPNVYYEVALAHAYGKPVVHIRHSSPDAIPFDIKDVRIFEYSFDIADASRAIGEVRGAAEHALENPGSVQTPVDRGRIIAQGASSPDIAIRTSADVLERLDRIDSSITTLLKVGAGTSSNDGLSPTERSILSSIRQIVDYSLIEDREDPKARGYQTDQMRRALDIAINDAISHQISRNRSALNQEMKKEYAVVHRTGPQT